MRRPVREDRSLKLCFPRAEPRTAGRARGGLTLGVFMPHTERLCAPWGGGVSPFTGVSQF